jgi:hypothetical protein
MAFDYKKEYREFYLPANKPEIVNVPAVNFIAVRGKGNPNEEDGEYKKAMGLLYGIAFTIKMSYKGSHKIDGYFEYVVAPLEGLWWMDGIDGIDLRQKGSVPLDMRSYGLPDFVKKEDFRLGGRGGFCKKEGRFSKVEFLTYDEGPLRAVHAYRAIRHEPATIELMDRYAAENGYETDISDKRRHHEIYLGDERKCDPAKLRTVIRHPIRKTGD